MNISMLLKTILLVTLLLAPLSAEETKESLNCDDSYNLCTEKCEQSENPSSVCFNTCDEAYDKCLESVEDTTKKSN